MNLQTFAEPTHDTVEAVERAIRLRTSGQIRELHVDISDGEVVLTGRTSTYYTKQLATHAVLDLVDDLGLSNEIEVC
jgi:hypothetical protein